MNQYNRLLHDANLLADVKDKSLNSQALHIAELTDTNVSLAAEVQRLRLEVLSVRAQLNLERTVVEEERIRREQSGSV